MVIGHFFNLNCSTMKGKSRLFNIGQDSFFLIAVFIRTLQFYNGQKIFQSQLYTHTTCHGVQKCT